MGKTHSPRHGSLSYWPRKRAKKLIPRVRNWPKVSAPNILSFCGFKVGMITVSAQSIKKTSMTSGEVISVPATVIECPPLKIFSVRFITKDAYGKKVASEILLSKEELLEGRVTLPKKDFISQNVGKFNSLSDKLSDYYDISVLMYTSPASTGLAQKVPNVFEVKLGGSVEEKYTFVKENISKEISIKDVFSQGEVVDVFAVTKGHGLKGPVRRFGISYKPHKSEKGRKKPGNLGAWSPAFVEFSVAQAGQTGFHPRLFHNVLILGIYDDLEKINPKSGFKRYGLVKNTYVVVKGSVPGSTKRPIVFRKAMRSTGLIKKEYDVKEFIV
jgi:large subunit ribosomal protein L3